ncbi:MAG: hydroxypyruvate isomerase [Rhodobacterales bacterium 12-65-15]|nr:MAG: hydroxypyruvate isomerase [Rhodobacterales bacterium 12-65-15]
MADWERALNGMPLALINTPPGDWASGDRGFAAIPGMELRFRDSFLRAADYAARLKVSRLHVMAGVAKGPLARDCYVENLLWARQEAPELTLTIEPLNPDDMPGYFLNDFDQAARILDDLGDARIGLQFDLWHAARLHGDAAQVWAEHRHQVNHIQIAGFPSRNEPGGGGFSVPDLCDEADAHCPGIWIAAEYRPTRGTAQGLGWLQALKSRTALIGA